ncbi:uncharacterized protein ARB_07284 [Trichophyton benhamiae CBS 112371]|uniref:Vacuolar ATPase assembly protein VMA22 n=1 Tax=Arthroderma benhamiae (strain ATCC MYA-4681 / CBS 112371) TaxID=663331 RepID=D4ASR9_ARTBC|nr:uncharacterized protein ARB_07284 [Trichophyton benhamiae CBS 112371]EFE33819.1 conserved hypothetical protein [Trichophyton benhamiae CBS 112371]
MTAPADGLHASLAEPAPAFKTVTIETKPDSSRDKDAKEGTDKPSEDEGEDVDEDEDEDEDHAQTPTETEETKEARTKSKMSNPLHWFGILVPPPLRNAQEAFVGAVAGPIPALAGVVSEMREVEHKVEGLRRAAPHKIAK